MIKLPLASIDYSEVRELSACARGFLGSFDAAWAVKSWASGSMSPLQVLAERESVYMLLSQTTPESLSKSFNSYTINPITRLVLTHRPSTLYYSVVDIVLYIHI